MSFPPLQATFFPPRQATFFPSLHQPGIWHGLLCLMPALLLFACGEPTATDNRFSGIDVERLNMAMPTMPGMEEPTAERSSVAPETGPWMVEADQLARDSATLVLILSPECPLCLDYATAFRELDAECAAQGIRVRGVFPGTYFPDKQIRMYLRRFQLDFPAWLDPDYELVHALNATTTPEAILLDAEGRTVYQGGIDNWAYALTRKRLEPTEHYLRDAIAAHLDGRTPDPAYTDPVGCLVE